MTSTNQNPIRKYSFNYFITKFLVKKDQNFLIREGIRKAKEQGLEIQLGDREILTLDNSMGRIDLPHYGKGVDVRELIALVADAYPERTKRYLANRKRLGM